MEINKPITLLGTIHVRKSSPLFKLFAISIILLFLIPSLAGCVTLSDPEASQEFNSDVVGVLNAHTNIGQSFVSRRPGLNGVTIWITPPTTQSNNPNLSGANQILVELFYSPDDPQSLFSTSLPAPRSGTNSPVTINIPSQVNPAGQSYYLLISVTEGDIQVNGRNEDAYPYGQAYINTNTVNSDIAFRLSYDYGFAAFMQDTRLFLANIWIVLPLLIILWLPGWLLLDISGLRKRIDIGGQIALALGLSLASIPLVMLWTTTLKLVWSRTGVLFISGVLVAFFIVRLAVDYLAKKRNQLLPEADHSITRSSTHQSISRLISINVLILTLIFIGSLTVRLIMIRDLATPAWVDSVHHALITRLIMDNGAYPSTYLPNENFSSTEYHPGFHSIAATFTWLSQLDLTRSLLILGQVLNALAIFSVYLLTKILTSSSRAGLFAAFITGFLTPMPAYYTSWGRYTELTGLLVLPAVLALVHLWSDDDSRKCKTWILLLGAIAAGGLFMIHYRVVVFMACLILAYLVVRITIDRRSTSLAPRPLILLILSLAAVSVVLVLPWIIPTIKQTLLPKLAVSNTGSVAAFQDFAWPYLTSAYGKQAMVLAGLGLIWSLIKKRSLALMIILWVLMLFFLSNLAALKLPGSGFINNSSVEIMLFIPISILGGYFLDQLVLNWQEIIPKRVNIPLSVVAIILIGFIGFLGSKRLVAILNPVTILSRQADLPAIQWVSEHIPKDETIVINPFAWGYGLYAGNDGGYWIEPLTGQLTIPPPVLYGLGSGMKLINQQCSQVISLCNDPASFSAYLLSQNIHYVFIGTRGGVIPPEKLVTSGLFESLYHQDGVWILSAIP